MSPRRALVVLNPVAGPSAQRVLQRDRLARALQEAGLVSEWHETTPECDADRIIADHPGEEPVVVIGGDGTVQAAVRALLGSGRPLLVIPRGTGNVLAQCLGLSPRLGPALRLLREGQVRNIDVGSLGGEPFLLTVGMGFDGRVVREADRKLKGQVGKLAYVVGAAKTLPLRHDEYEIFVDGKVHHERSVSVTVANFGTYIGPFLYPPEADGTDGQLDVSVSRAETIEQVLSLFGATFLPRELREKGLKVIRGTEIRIRCAQPIPVQVDGEDRGDHHEVVCTLDPRTLGIYTP